MHGVEENSMTGARGTQVVNGSTAPPAAAQVGPPIVATKIINKGGVISPPTSSGASSSVALCQQQGAIINIMSRPGTVATATPNGTPVSVPLQPGMQIVNMRPNQGIQMTSGRSLSPRMIVNQIPNVRPGQTGQQLTLQSLPSLPPGTQGHLIVKTENGQLQLLRVNTAPPNATQIPPNGTPTNSKYNGGTSSE
ncbi:hypothetical protein Avbf_05092 [Armadillidium vulgare]|nr:hypothetical protein Avbf_05092 [Armadillidium vulgare]